MLWRENYSPFGEPRQNPAGNTDDQGFTGHIHDTGTGLTYMQARYYDPVIGRFLSHDPVGFASGGPGYFNRYAYTANDPVNLVDPTGMCAVGDYGELIDCPEATPVDGGFLLQGADFNGYRKDILTASDMATLKEAVAILDRVTATEAGQ